MYVCDCIKNKQNDSHFRGQMAVFALERFRVRVGVSSKGLLGIKPTVWFRFEIEGFVGPYVHLFVGDSCNDERQIFVKKI